MKKQLHLLSFFIGSLLISGSAYAQINYTEDFDGEEITWPSNEFAVTNELSCDGNSYRANLYTGFIPNNNAETVSGKIIIDKREISSDGSFLAFPLNRSCDIKSFQ